MVGVFFFFKQQEGRDMNLINAAESMVKSKADEYAFIMNTCVQDQTAENLDKFLEALTQYQAAVSQYEVIQGLKQQMSSQKENDTDTDTDTNED